MFTPTAFGKGGILRLCFRKTGRHIAVLTLEQMCRLFYLKRAFDYVSSSVMNSGRPPLKSPETGRRVARSFFASEKVSRMAHLVCIVSPLSELRQSEPELPFPRRWNGVAAETAQQCPEPSACLGDFWLNLADYLVTARSLTNNLRKFGGRIKFLSVQYHPVTLQTFTACFLTKNLENTESFHMLMFPQLLITLFSMSLPEVVQKAVQTVYHTGCSSHPSLRQSRQQHYTVFILAPALAVNQSLVRQPVGLKNRQTDYELQVELSVHQTCNFTEFLMRLHDVHNSTKSSLSTCDSPHTATFFTERSRQRLVVLIQSSKDLPVCIKLYVCVCVCVWTGVDVQWQVQPVTAATVSAAAEEIQSAIPSQYTHTRTALQHEQRVCVCVSTWLVSVEQVSNLEMLRPTFSLQLLG